MEFGKNLTIDEIIRMILQQNPPGKSRIEKIYCLSKIPSTVLDIFKKVDPDPAKDFWNLINIKTPSDTLIKIMDYRENINQGHKLSRGHPKDKIKASRFFQNALSISNDLIDHSILPKWLFISLKTDAISRDATCDFYKGKYKFAIEKLVFAERELRQYIDRKIFPVEGLVDKEIALKWVQLSSYTVNAAKENWDNDQLEERTKELFDKKMTYKIRNAMTVGGGHTDNYIGPLSRWIEDLINEKKLKFKYEDLPPINILLGRADRLEFMDACARYLANRGWLDIYLYSKIGKEEFLKSSIKNYNIAMDAQVDAHCNAYGGHFFAEKGATTQYCDDNKYHSKEVQIGITRNTCYRLVASKLSDGEIDSKPEYNRITQLWEKELNYEKSPIIVADSIITAGRNIKELGLDESWKKVAEGFPTNIKNSLNC